MPIISLLATGSRVISLSVPACSVTMTPFRELRVPSSRDVCSNILVKANVSSSAVSAVLLSISGISSVVITDHSLCRCTRETRKHEPIEGSVSVVTGIGPSKGTQHRFGSSGVTLSFSGAPIGLVYPLDRP